VRGRMTNIRQWRNGTRDSSSFCDQRMSTRKGTSRKRVDQDMVRDVVPDVIYGTGKGSFTDKKNGEKWGK